MLLHFPSLHGPEICCVHLTNSCIIKSFMNLMISLNKANYYKLLLYAIEIFINLFSFIEGGRLPVAVFLRIT